MLYIRTRNRKLVHLSQGALDAIGGYGMGAKDKSGGEQRDLGSVMSHDKSVNEMNQGE